MGLEDLWIWSTKNFNIKKNVNGLLCLKTREKTNFAPFPEIYSIQRYEILLVEIRQYIVNRVKGKIHQFIPGFEAASESN